MQIGALASLNPLTKFCRKDSLWKKRILFANSMGTTVSTGMMMLSLKRWDTSMERWRRKLFAKRRLRSDVEKVGAEVGKMVEEGWRRSKRWKTTWQNRSRWSVVKLQFF